MKTTTARFQIEALREEDGFVWLLAVVDTHPSALAHGAAPIVFVTNHMATALADVSLRNREIRLGLPAGERPDMWPEPRCT